MTLLWWAFLSFVVAVVAGLFGFRNVSSGAAATSRVLFGIFLVIALVVVVLAFMGVGAAV